MGFLSAAFCSLTAAEGISTAGSELSGAGWTGSTCSAMMSNPFNEMISSWRKEPDSCTPLSSGKTEAE